MSIKVGSTVVATENYITWLTKGKKYTVTDVWWDKSISVIGNCKRIGAFDRHYFKETTPKEYTINKLLKMNKKQIGKIMFKDITPVEIVVLLLKEIRRLRR